MLWKSQSWNFELHCTVCLYSPKAFQHFSPPASNQLLKILLIQGYQQFLIEIFLRSLGVLIKKTIKKKHWLVMSRLCGLQKRTCCKTSILFVFKTLRIVSLASSEGVKLGDGGVWGCSGAFLHCSLPCSAWKALHGPLLGSPAKD